MGFINPFGEMRSGGREKARTGRMSRKEYRPAGA